MTQKVIFVLPVWVRPLQVTVDSLRASLPILEAAGWEHGLAQVRDVPYISAARASAIRAALDEKPDVIFCIDQDVSWRPRDLLKLIETEGDVVAGTYRPKIDDEQYMGTIEYDPVTFIPKVRKSDGAIAAKLVPAGFLKLTPNCIDKFMQGYPQHCYGPMFRQSVDLFNHGVHDRVWYGEDYSFSLNWRKLGGELWIVPDVNIDHHKLIKNADGTEEMHMYPGNLHEYLLRQEGGSNAPVRLVA